MEREIAQWVHPTKDRSDDPSHHERTLLPRSYIPLPWPNDYNFQELGHMSGILLVLFDIVHDCNSGHQPNGFNALPIT